MISATTSGPFGLVHGLMTQIGKHPANQPVDRGQSASLDGGRDEGVLPAMDHQGGNVELVRERPSSRSWVAKIEAPSLVDALVSTNGSAEVGLADPGVPRQLIPGDRGRDQKGRKQPCQERGQWIVCQPLPPPRAGDERISKSGRGPLGEGIVEGDQATQRVAHEDQRPCLRS